MKKNSETIKERLARANGVIKGIASTIENAGKERIEGGYNKLNTTMLVSFQLVRAIEGNIGICLNPHCCRVINYYHPGDARYNPLNLSCSDECYDQAVRSSIESVKSQLEMDIAGLDQRVRGLLLTKSSSRVSKGEEVDAACIQTPDSNELVLAMKRTRLRTLSAFLRKISKEEMITPDCQGDNCDEEIPLHVRMLWPEIDICPSCQEKNKSRGR